MAAPTLIDVQFSEFDADNLTEETPSMTWQAGDFIVVLGMFEQTIDNQFADPPVATGITFTDVSGTPTQTSGTVRGYGWTATAASGGSSTFEITYFETDNDFCGIIVFIFRGSTGLGNTAVSTTLGATTVQALTRSGANSHVVQMWGDRNAVDDASVTWGTPSSGTQQLYERLAGRATYYAGSWGDQGAAGGPTNYGFTNHAGGANMTAITLEILGSGAGATLGMAVSSPAKNIRIR